MPRKSKTEEDSRPIANGSSLEKKVDRKPARVRSTTTKKPRAKKTPAKKRINASKPVPAIEPNDEEIRTRAYFVAEKRHQLGLPGDANTDWLEAKRQLLSETAPR